MEGTTDHAASDEEQQDGESRRPTTTSIALARATPVSDEPTKHFAVEVADDLARAALASIASGAGWVERPAGATGALLIIDHAQSLSRQGPARAHVMALDSSPFAARCGLDAVASGAVMSLVVLDRPHELVDVLEGLTNGRGSIPVDVYDRAETMPAITVRQVAILGRLVAGSSNRDIARALFLSEASVKREVSKLFEVLHVDTRLSLSAAAAKLGIGPLAVVLWDVADIR